MDAVYTNTTPGRPFRPRFGQIGSQRAVERLSETISMSHSGVHCSQGGILHSKIIPKAHMVDFSVFRKTGQHAAMAEPPVVTLEAPWRHK